MFHIKYDHFKEACQAKNLKATTQRYIIFKTLLGTTNHPTADHLFAVVGRELPGLGRDTVYRTLNILSDCGLVRRLMMPGGATHFDGNVSDHHHFLCDACGRILDLEWPEFGRLSWPKEACQLGKPRQASVLIMGLCRHCGEKTIDPTTEHLHSDGTKPENTGL